MQIALLFHRVGYSLMTSPSPIELQPLNREIKVIGKPDLASLRATRVLRLTVFLVLGCIGAKGILAVISNGCSHTSFQFRKGKSMPATSEGVLSLKLI
jgi:hypothetical protein